MASRNMCARGSQALCIIDSQSTQCRFYHDGRLRVSSFFPKLSRFTESSPYHCLSQKLMFYNNIIAASEANGTFNLLPCGMRSFEKLVKVIDQEMQSIGAQKIQMPCLHSKSQWDKSDRWDLMGSELFKLEDRLKKKFCLAPTHEEVVTSLVADYKVSMKQLPVMFYQIGRKYRDEPRSKYGLLRGREFDMKDLYTFDATIETATETYWRVIGAYKKIFELLELEYYMVHGDTGNIGGVLSHEFHLSADIGEDKINICEICNEGTNEEIADTETDKILKNCENPNCNKTFNSSKGIEIAHAFLLGTKYSSIFNAMYSDTQEVRRPLQMGCYGIGVTRLLAATVEVLSSEPFIKWPRLIAPYQVFVIPQKAGYKDDVTNKLAEDIFDKTSSLPNLRGEVVLDDDIKLSIGARKKDASRRGIPYVVVVGKTALESPPRFELFDLHQNPTNPQGETYTMEELLQTLSTIKTLSA